MPWVETIFEREALFAEVWNDPVSTVAKRYRVSDVGLRKVCIKLGVPVPPLGYWAKIAAGQLIERPKLPEHSGPTRHVRQQYDDENAPERSERITALFEAEPPPASSPVALKATVAECHTSIRRTGRMLKALSYNGRGLLHSHGADVFEMSVAPPNKDRALRILDAVVRACIDAGGKLVFSTEERQQLMVQFRGESFRVCIRESSTRTERDLTREEVKQKRAGNLSWIPDRYSYVPTGKLRLEIREEASYSSLHTLSDTAVPLEQRLDGMVPFLCEKAAELRVRREMRQEEHRHWEKQHEIQQELEDRRDEELERLKDIEELAERWKRARNLRAYADALESASRADATAAEAAEETAWIRNAADWLDPLIDKHWPSVDINEDIGEDEM